MKKVIVAVSVAASFALANDAAALQAQIDELKAQIVKLQAAQQKVVSESKTMKKEITAVKKHDAHDNIKFSADFRTAYNMVDYKLAKAKAPDANGIWTNKLLLKMSAQPIENLIFKGSFGMYKAFGSNNSFAYNPYQSMDWYGTNAPSNSIFRLREAYFLYLGQMGDMPYTASFGRRPSLNGYLVNYREDNSRPQSPTGHNINMEFDGASFKFDFDQITPISGLYLKLCLGRGNSKVDAKYPTFTGFMGSLGMPQMMGTALPYSKDTNYDSPNMDLAGVIAQLYNDGQYKVLLNYFQAWNVMGANFTRMTNADGSIMGGNPMEAAAKAMQAGGDRNAAMGAYMQTAMQNRYAINMTDVGDMTGGALGLEISGIGDGWSDFLDDTNFFASVAFSKTDPKGTHSTMMSQMNADMANMQSMMQGKQPTATAQTTEMLGTNKSKVGTSFYVGVNFPVYFSGDRLGLEYNHGSKYWRSFTYGEDTLVGSKLATRGDAFEIFYNVPLLSKYLTAQVRYTYLDYDYTGSHMFFGSTGTPMSKSQAEAMGMDFVENASELRLSLRYRY